MKLLGMLFSPSSCPISHVPALFQPSLDNSTLSRPLSTHVSLFPAAFLSRTSICVFHMAAMHPTETFHKGTLIGLTALIFVMVVIHVDGVRNVSELQLLISLLFILRILTGENWSTRTSVPVPPYSWLLLGVDIYPLNIRPSDRHSIPGRVKGFFI
jgi:hypothetical protein